MLGHSVENELKLLFLEKRRGKYRRKNNSRGKDLASIKTPRKIPSGKKTSGEKAKRGKILGEMTREEMTAG